MWQWFLCPDHKEISIGYLVYISCLQRLSQHHYLRAHTAWFTDMRSCATLPHSKGATLQLRMCNSGPEVPTGMHHCVTSLFSNLFSTVIQPWSFFGPEHPVRSLGTLIFFSGHFSHKMKKPCPLGGFLLTTNFLFLSFLKKLLWLHHKGCGILFPQPGTESMPPVVGAQGLNHWATREVPHH